MYAPVVGSRVLSEAELATVLAAYRSLEPGVSGPCASLDPPEDGYSMQVDGSAGEWIVLMHEATSCDHDEQSVWYTPGLDELRGAIEELVP